MQACWFGIYQGRAERLALAAMHASHADDVTERLALAAMHASHADDVRDTNCQAQNGSIRSRIFRTFNVSF